MGKKKKFVPKDFESMKGIHDTSANIYRSMLLHQVCRDLTASQFRLYVYCKSEFYGKNLFCISVAFRFCVNWGLAVKASLFAFALIGV